MVTAVILASGLSRRFGAQKLKERVKGKMLVNYSVSNYEGRVDELICVVSPDIELVRACSRVSKLVVNSRPAQGISRSIRLGLSCISEDTSCFFIGLGDQPFLKGETIEKLIEVMKRYNAYAVVPVYKGIRGNPVLFSYAAKNDIISSVKADSGARNVIKKKLDRTYFVELDDFGVRFDVDTKKELEIMKKLIKNSSLVRGAQ